MRVIAEAKRAWQIQGETVSVSVTPINGQGHLTSLATSRSRRVEYIVETDDPDVWETLAAVPSEDRWQLCALVPLSRMGTAHERLCDRGFEIQAWWVEGGRVAFGGVEIA